MVTLRVTMDVSLVVSTVSLLVAGGSFAAAAGSFVVSRRADARDRKRHEIFLEERARACVARAAAEALVDEAEHIVARCLQHATESPHATQIFTFQVDDRSPSALRELVRHLRGNEHVISASAVAGELTVSVTTAPAFRALMKDVSVFPD